MRVAAFQMRTTADPERNAQKIETALGKASGKGADVLVCPECAVSGYLPEPDLDYRHIADLVERIRRTARCHRIALVLGCSIRENGRLYNRGLLFSRAGRLILTYDKVALTGGDAKVFARGSRFAIGHLNRVPVGLQICFDMRYPENWRILRSQGVRIVFHLVNASRGGAWKRPVLAGTMACRAAENGIFIVAANDARPQQMMVSTINDPNGKLLAAARPDREEMIFADLDLKDPNLTRNWIWQARPIKAWRKPAYRKLLLRDPR